MTAPGTQQSKDPHMPLQHAYRVTFQEYADRLRALQRLIDIGKTGTEDFRTALKAVEAARAAHSQARDCLAKDLMRQTKSAASADEQQIRKTARLIWEFAGRPEGTAEHDWHRAEKLVR